MNQDTEDRRHGSFLDQQVLLNHDNMDRDGDGSLLSNNHQHAEQFASPSSSDLWDPEILVNDDDDTSFLRGTAITTTSTISLSRLLSEPRRSSDGTLAVLMIVCSLFCFIWAPVMLRRCRGPNSHQRAQEDIRDLARFEAEARAMRATLQRMSMMGNVLSGGAAPSGGGASGDGNTPEEDQQLEHRREFLDNALLTKKVIFQLEENDDVAKKDGKEKDTSVDDDNTKSKESSEDASDSTVTAATSKRQLPRRQKSNIIVLMNTTKHTTTPANPTTSINADDHDRNNNNNTNNNDDDENNDKVDDEQAVVGDAEILPSSPSAVSQESQLDACSICLADYDDGDDICWSHNDKCNHFFHKVCIQTWLLTHEECPCCRQDFLCLWGNDDDDNEIENDQGRTSRNTSGNDFNNSDNAIGFQSNSFFRQPSNRLGRASSTLGIAEGSSRHDWVEELADEIQDRILHRQQELQLELFRREQEERQREFVSSLMMGSSALSAGSLNHHNSVSSATDPQQQSNGAAPINTVLSVDDMAAGWLLYRHLHLHSLASSNRSIIPRRQSASNNGEGQDEDNDDDVHVADLSLPRGLEPWQTYTHENPIVVSDYAHAPTTSLFEMVERSTRRLGEERLPPRRLSQPRPIRFLNAGRESSSRVIPRRSSNGTGRHATAPENDRRNPSDRTMTSTGSAGASPPGRNDPASQPLDNFVDDSREAGDDEVLNSTDA